MARLSKIIFSKTHDSLSMVYGMGSSQGCFESLPRLSFFSLKTSNCLLRIHISDKTLGCQFSDRLFVILERQWNRMVTWKAPHWSEFCQSEDLTICSTYRGRKGVSEKGHSQPSHTMNKWQSYETLWGDAKYSQSKGGDPEFLWEEACRGPSQVQWSSLWMSWISGKRDLVTPESKW